MCNFAFIFLWTFEESLVFIREQNEMKNLRRLEMFGQKARRITSLRGYLSWAEEHRLIPLLLFHKTGIHRQLWTNEYNIYSNKYFNYALWKYRRHGHVPSLSIFCRSAGLAEFAFNSSSSDFNSAAVFLDFVAEINSLIAQAVWK